MICAGEMNPLSTIKDLLKEMGMVGELAPSSRQIHVLVGVPIVSLNHSGLWLVRGWVRNAFNVKSTRGRIYKLAGYYLGYYDPILRVGGSDRATWYGDGEDRMNLYIRVLFKKERDALIFYNALHDESITMGSPLYKQEIEAHIVPAPAAFSPLRRVLTRDYNPAETDSPENTASNSSVTSIVDMATDMFKYQRIEHEGFFGHLGKAQSCHLMSHAHCQDHTSYEKYDKDESNRLALSSEMHGWYDGTFPGPVMNISIASVPERPAIGDRYKVDLIVQGIDSTYGNLILA